MRIDRERALARVQLQLLLRRRWAYLRYLHLREGFLQAGGRENVESFLSIGCGAGVAEVMLALEFPHVSFKLTDIGDDARMASILGARMAREWDIDNVSIGQHDVFAPSDDFDMVASVEVLEHIDDDDTAAKRLRETASGYVFTLVPYATDAMNDDPARKERAWRRQQHYRVGYSAERLAALFPDATAVRGCYWQRAGLSFRERLDACTDEDIRKDTHALAEAGQADLIDAVPKHEADCYGIWSLAPGIASA